MWPRGTPRMLQQSKPCGLATSATALRYQGENRRAGWLFSVSSAGILLLFPIPSIFWANLVYYSHAKTAASMPLTASPAGPPRCPYCRARMTPAQKTLAGNPWFPFCGERCKMADLSNWFDGVYAIEQPLATLTDEQGQDLPAPAPPAAE